MQHRASQNKHGGSERKGKGGEGRSGVKKKKKFIKIKRA